VRGKKGGAEAEASRKRQQAYLKMAGVGALVIAILAFSFQAQFGRTGGVTTIGTNETEQLKEIFFSGQPWLIQCVGPGISLDSSFVAAAPHLAANTYPYSPVKTAALPCGDKLPSGKTIYDRFKLDRRLQPLVALFANGDKPQVCARVCGFALDRARRCGLHRARRSCALSLLPCPRRAHPFAFLHGSE
jgi:hypothetical protein